MCAACIRLKSLSLASWMETIVLGIIDLEVMLGDRKHMSHNWAHDQPSVPRSSVCCWLTLPRSQFYNRLPWSAEPSWSQVKSSDCRNRNCLNGLSHLLQLYHVLCASWPDCLSTPQPITLHCLFPDYLSVGTKNVCMFLSYSPRSLFLTHASHPSLCSRLRVHKCLT